MIKQLLPCIGKYRRDAILAPLYVTLEVVLDILIPLYMADLIDFGIDMGYRLPVFDVKISAQTKSAYTKAAQNELALALYNQGVFNPNMTDQALMLLDMMDFDGKDEVMQKVSQNGTLMQQMAMYQQIALQLAQQYDPMMAEQLAQSIMGGAQAGGAMPTGSAPKLSGGDPGGAQGKVNKARARSNQSSQPTA